MNYTFILANDSSLDAAYVTMESFTGMHGHKDPVPILSDFLLEDVYQPFKSHPTKHTYHSTKVTMSHAESLFSRKLDCSFRVG